MGVNVAFDIADNTDDIEPQMSRNMAKPQLVKPDKNIEKQKYI